MWKLGVPRYLNLVSDAISIGWIELNNLKRYSGCYIMGGARNECLKEVQLLYECI